MILETEDGFKFEDLGDTNVVKEFRLLGTNEVKTIKKLLDIDYEFDSLIICNEK
jgi:hypothetical protein